jgi:O-antigen ligase
MPAFYYWENKKIKKFIIILIVLNIYMIAYWGERSAWVALFNLFLFLLFVFRLRFIKTISHVLLILITISAILIIFLDSKRFSYEILHGKFGSVKVFLSEGLRKLPMISTPRDKKPIQTKQAKNKQLYNLPQPSDKIFKSNLSWRLIIWGAALRNALKYPIFGNGFGTFFTGIKPWSKAKIGVDSGIVPAHSHILEIFHRMGFLGLSLFLYINIFVFVYGFNYLKHAKTNFTKICLIGGLGSFVCWHSMALFINVINSPPTSIFLWLMMGLIFASIERDKNYA